MMNNKENNIIDLNHHHHHGHRRDHKPQKTVHEKGYFRMIVSK